MAQHSSIVGGSTAGRLINCPGSHQATLALPAGADDLPSEYANEGSAMHEVMARAMADRMHGIERAVRGMIGETVYDRVLTAAHVEQMIEPALAALAELERTYGGGFKVVGVEVSVKFPKIPGAFGTCDLILQSDTHTIVCDWKFGAGVGVKAVYWDTSDADGDSCYVNPQLMYYLTAALRSKPAWFRSRELVIAIIQPRGMEPLTHTVVGRNEVNHFIKDIERGVLAAIGRDPPRVKGEWCRFAPCKTACPLWTGPLLELVALRDRGAPKQELNQNPHRVSVYGEYLAHAKALIDTLVLLKATIDEQMHTYLEKGGVIPGWRLKHKTKVRQWVDNDTVAQVLGDLGFAQDQIWQDKLVTFASADATAKKLGVTIPEFLRVAPPATETTLATTDDPAPVVEPAKLVEQFSASLKLLRQGKRQPVEPAALSKK